MLLVVTEGGLAVVAADWGMDDVVLHTCGPAELEARIRLAIGRLRRAARRRRPRGARDPLRRGRRSTTRRTPPSSAAAPLDLTFKEFELLKYLAQHPGRVFTREQLLQEVWGYDYFGGTRTVDVHVRRLRAKLGPENETLIGTVRNVGYRFVLPPKESATGARERLSASGHRGAGHHVRHPFGLRGGALGGDAPPAAAAGPVRCAPGSPGSGRAPVGGGPAARPAAACPRGARARAAARDRAAVRAPRPTRMSNTCITGPSRPVEHKVAA